MRFSRLTLLIPILCAALQAQNTTAFEVAVIKPSKTNIGHDGEIKLDPGRLSVRNATLKRIIVEAWQIPYSQITGGPAWLTSDEFDIDAKPSAPASAAEAHVMLQTLLIDRFRLSTHLDSKERRVYELTVARGGSKLAHDPASSSGTWHFHGDLAKFAAILSTQLTIPLLNDPTRPSFATGAAIPVLNKTGIPGDFDIALDLKPESGGDTFTVWQRALQEQLGLRLESNKGMAVILIIDHVEKLTDRN